MKFYSKLLFFHVFVAWEGNSIGSAFSFINSPAFVKRINSRIKLFQYREDDHADEEMNYYDDFDDFNFIPGDSADDNKIETDPKLSNLLEKSRVADDQRNLRISQNWETGNWKCRGFSLDKFDPVRSAPGDVNNESDFENGTNSGIQISQIAFDEKAIQSNFTTSETIAVGRSDGTVYMIQLGDAYLTKFKYETKMSMQGNWDDKDTSSGGEEGPSARIESEMVSEEDIEERLCKAVRDDVMGADVIIDGRIPKDVSTPFEIEHQFQAHDQGISSMLFNDDTIFTSEKGKGAIKVWNMHDLSVPVHILDNVHTDDVVALKMLSSAPLSKDRDILLSASRDGSFALWDLKGNLLYRCEIVDDNENPTAVTCADVDTTGDEHIVYLGLSSGHIVCYAASELLHDASEGKSSTCPVPKCRFVAHDPSLQKNSDDSHHGVTAIRCGGNGQMSNSVTSTILLTGGADGIIKQYQMIKQKRPSKVDNEPSTDWGLMHWPRLPTQRVKDCAHIFKGHYKAITSLLYDGGESSKILSAGADGSVRVWDPSAGSELYRMDGFKDLTCLCLDKEILVTNGMNEYVCVHDFDVADDLSDSYDLNW